MAVVNHSQQGNSIEIFEYGDAGLTHEKTITDPLLISPNDLVFINKTQLYITNDHGNSSKWGKTIEEYLQLARSNVLFYDGSECTTVIKKLKYANGINVSEDRNVLYVAETVGKKISEYAIDENSNALTFITSTYLNSGVDNIELDREGNLWIGSHPQLLTFTRHAKNSDIFSPSQAFKVSLSDNNRVDEIYLNDGGKLSGSSVAAVWEDNLLIGPVLEDHFLHCLFE